MRAERADYFDAGVTAQAAARPDARPRRLLQDRPEPARRRPVRRADHPHLVQLRQRHRQRRRVQRQLRRRPVVGLFATSPGRQRHRHQHQLRAVQFRPGRARLHRQQLHLPRPQPGLDLARPAPPTPSTADTDWATRVSADMLFGSGLRTTRRHAQRPVAARLCRRQRLAGAEAPDRPRQGARRCASTSSTCSTTATRCATARASASAPRNSASGGPSW